MVNSVSRKLTLLATQRVRVVHKDQPLRHLIVVPAHAGTHNRRPSLWPEAVGPHLSIHTTRRRDELRSRGGPCFRRDDRVVNTRPYSRDANSPELCTELSHSRWRAQGKPDAQCTRSLVCKIKKHTSVVTTGSPERSGLPCAMVLTVSFALSPAIGLCCRRHQRNAQALSPT